MGHLYKLLGSVENRLTWRDQDAYHLHYLAYRHHHGAAFIRGVAVNHRVHIACGDAKRDLAYRGP